MREPHKIIPGLTPCCGPQHCVVHSDGLLELDADCVVDGDQLTCPVHHEVIIYTFGTRWWKHEGGSYDHNAKIKAYCYTCSNLGKVYNIDTWSYRG